MGALHDLVARELSQIGMRAQDEIEDHESWMDISEHLSLAWRKLHARQFEESATIAATVKRKTDKIIEEERCGAGRR